MLLRLSKTIPLFTVVGLVGPVVRMAVPTWPNPIGAFVYDLTWFTWPTQAMAVIEVNVGRLIAFLAATGANVVLFLILGVLLGLFGGTRAGIWAFGAILVGSLVYWALLGAGHDPAFVNYGALCVAFAFYLGPVWLAQKRGWIAARPRKAA